MTERGRNVPISKILKVFIFHTILMLFLRSVHLNGLVMGHMKIAILFRKKKCYFISDCVSVECRQNSSNKVHYFPLKYNFKGGGEQSCYSYEFVYRGGFTM